MTTIPQPLHHEPSILLLGYVTTTLGLTEGAISRQLLALLALNAGKPVCFSKIADELWEGNPPRENSDAISTAIYALKKRIPVLRPYIRYTEGGHVLYINPRDVDALRFKALVNQAMAQKDQAEKEKRISLKQNIRREARLTIESAMSLVRGPILSGIPRGRPLESAYETLEEYRRDAFLAQMEITLQLGEHKKAIRPLQEAWNEDRTQEDLAVLYMLALYRSLRGAGAIRNVYRRTREALEEELGVCPNARLKEICSHILGGSKEILNPEWIP